MQFHSANDVDLDAVSIHGDDELDEIDKEIKGLADGGAGNDKKTPQKGTMSPFVAIPRLKSPVHVCTGSIAKWLREESEVMWPSG